MQDMSFHYFRTHFAENKRWLQFVVREGDIYFQLYSWRGKGTQTDTFLNLFQNLQQHLERAQEQMLMPIHPSSQYPTEIVSKDEFTLIGPFTARLKGFLARQREKDPASNSSAATATVSKLDFMSSRFLSSGSVGGAATGSMGGFGSGVPNSKGKFRKNLHAFSKSSSKKRALESRGWSGNDEGADYGAAGSSICEEQIEMIDYDSILRHFKYEKILGGPIMPGEHKSRQSDLASALVRKA